MSESVKKKYKQFVKWFIRNWYVAICGDNYLYACQELDRLTEKQSRIVQDKDFDPHFVIFSQIDLQIIEANDLICKL